MATSYRRSTTSYVDLDDSSVASRYVGIRMTLEEFLALPEVKPYLEWDAGVLTQKDMPDGPVKGVVSQKMAPKADHGSIELEFGSLLRNAARPGRLGWAFSETRFVTPGWCPVPDVSYYRAERIHPQSRDSFGDFTEPPDIAVEIVSPSQSLSEQLKKCLRCAELGGAVSLVVDPSDRAIYVVRPAQPLQVLRDDDQIDLFDVLPGFTLTVRELFEASSPASLFEETGTAIEGAQEAPDGSPSS